MRILVDANVIISAGLFPEYKITKAFKHIVQNHDLILCQYTLDELKDVFKRKFPQRIEYLNKFVKDLKYEMVNIEITDFKKYPQNRDKDDIPVLAYAQCL